MATDSSHQYPQLIKTLTALGKYVQRTYKDNLKKKNKNASGKLFNSIDYRIEATDKGCKLYFVAEKYYINIENGRRAGAKMPPLEVIKRWMQLKNIKPRDGQSAKSAAYLIARSIGKKGIKPNPFLRDIKKSIKDWVDEIKLAIEDDLKVDVAKISSRFKTIQGNKHIQFKKK